MSIGITHGSSALCDRFTISSILSSNRRERRKNSALSEPTNAKQVSVTCTESQQSSSKAAMTGCSHMSIMRVRAALCQRVSFVFSPCFYYLSGKMIIYFHILSFRWFQMSYKRRDCPDWWGMGGAGKAWIKGIGCSFSLAMLQFCIVCSALAYALCYTWDQLELLKLHFVSLFLLLPVLFPEVL